MYQEGQEVNFYVPLKKATDKAGNRIIYGVASDESLDTDGQIVKASGIKESLDYFLKHGALDYDHKAHIGECDPKYLVGEPLDAKVKDKTFFIKAKLYKGMPIADSLWGLIQNGAKMGFSVGGKVLKIENEFDESIGKSIPKISKVLLTHVAVTKHPVNAATQASTKDSWKVFMKSLSHNPDGTVDVVREIERYYKSRDKNSQLYKAVKHMIRAYLLKTLDTSSGAPLKKQSLEKDAPPKKKKLGGKKLKKLIKSDLRALIRVYLALRG